MRGGGGQDSPFFLKTNFVILPNKIKNWNGCVISNLFIYYLSSSLI